MIGEVVSHYLSVHGVQSSCNDVLKRYMDLVVKDKCVVTPLGAHLVHSAEPASHQVVVTLSKIRMWLGILSKRLQTDWFPGSQWYYAAKFERGANKVEQQRQCQMKRGFTLRHFTYSAPGTNFWSAVSEIKLEGNISSKNEKTEVKEERDGIRGKMFERTEMRAERYVAETSSMSGDGKKEPFVNNGNIDGR